MKMADEETVTIYDIDIPKDLWENLEEKLEKVDPSRNDSRKHYAKQAIKLLDMMLGDEIEDINRDLDDAERRISRMRQRLAQ